VNNPGQNISGNPGTYPETKSVLVLRVLAGRRYAIPANHAATDDEERAMNVVTLLVTDS
jgi:hypothetical protein